MAGLQGAKKGDWVKVLNDLEWLQNIILEQTQETFSVKSHWDIYDIIHG